MKKPKNTEEEKREREMAIGKETGRRCSHCGNNGHNSRTCNGKEKEKVGMKLFGVRILKKEDETLKKSFSTESLRSCMTDPSSSDPGCLSDGLLQTRRITTQERKRGMSWTGEEHRFFLEGLAELGKGDWRGISKNFVTTRTPTQVASHAQKYFLRQNLSIKKKRRSSLFDVAIKISSGVSVHSTSQVTGDGFKSPPISPMTATAGAPYLNGFPLMARFGSMRLNHPAAEIMPTASYIPVMNYHNQGYAYLAGAHSNLSTLAPLPSQMPIHLSPQVQQRDSQVDPEASTTVNTDLGLGIAYNISTT